MSRSPVTASRTVETAQERTGVAKTLIVHLNLARMDAFRMRGQSGERYAAGCRLRDKEGPTPQDTLRRLSCNRHVGAGPLPNPGATVVGRGEGFRCPRIRVVERS
ncbi:hypothetical protein GCM10022629_57160 [Amorphoplanes auranticolor]